MRSRITGILRRWPAAPVVALLFLALALRLWRLDYHSLWFDETVSVHWASQSPWRIWAVGMSLVEDKHPPVYHLLLHAWMSLVGSSDVAVRSLGVLFGALAVLPVFGIGRLFGSRRIGALAALLVAVNPFLVWYSQEVRMFMPATTMGLVGLYALLRAWCGSRRSDGDTSRTTPKGYVGWLGVALAGLVGATYSYLFGLFFLVIAGVWLVALQTVTVFGDRDGRTWKSFMACAAMLAVALALVAPLLWAAWRVSQAESLPGGAFGQFTTVMRNLLTAFSLYKGPWAAWMSAVAWPALGILAAVGMIAPSGQESVGGVGAAVGRICLGGLLVVPLVIGGVLQVRDRSVFDEARYFIVFVPGLCLLWGRALDIMILRIKWLGLGLLATMLAVMIVALSHLWLPQSLREDWRTAARYVQSHAGSNDAVLVHVDYVHVAFERYFDGPLPVFFPFSDQLQDTAQIDAPLTGLLGFDSVWLVQSHTEQFDRDHLVERWFADRFPLATEQYPAGVTVKRFITRYRLPGPPVDVPGIRHPFGSLVSLVGCSVAEASTLATDERSHPPSAWVHATLYWQAEARPLADYSSSVRMVDSQGQVWGDKLTRERETLRMWPTSRWEPSEIVRDEVDVNLNPRTPDGEYRIVVSLLDENGEPLGSEFPCAEVRVGR